MRKVVAGVAWYALLSINIALLLGACMKPVDAKPFLKGDRGDEPVKGKTEVGIDLWFENPEDVPPELQANVRGTLSPLAADGTVTASLGSLSSVTITVINAEDYDVIEWHYNFSPAATGPALTLDLITAIDKTGSYPLTVIGKKGDLLYSTLFYVNVGS